jgi:hypothetical protein
MVNYNSLETEEGFCLIFSKKVNIEEIEESSGTEDTSESLDTEEEEGPIISNIRQLMKVRKYTGEIIHFIVMSCEILQSDKKKLKFMMPMLLIT